MYIKYKEVEYPCTCRPSADMVYRGLSDDFPVPVSGEIQLCADDGFVMRTDTVEDYLRQTFENGTLTLTNIAELVLDEDEVETEYTPRPFDQLRADVDYIAIMTGVEL